MRSFQGRRGRLPSPALVAAMTLALCAQPVAAQRLDKAIAYKALTGDDLDATDPPPIASAGWAGGPPGLLVVATLDGGDDASDDLGTLHVGLLTRQGAALKVVASNEDVDEPAMTRAIRPSTPEVRIERAIYRISPTEVAVAVDVSETLETTSTSAQASTLRLYRRVGGKLLPIFSAETDDTTRDKSTPGGRETASHVVVRFTPHLTRGFFDLVRQKRGGSRSRLYAWNGARYAPVSRR